MKSTSLVAAFLLDSLSWRQIIQTFRTNFIPKLMLLAIRTKISGWMEATDWAAWLLYHSISSDTKTLAPRMMKYGWCANSLGLPDFYTIPSHLTQRHWHTNCNGHGILWRLLLEQCSSFNWFKKKKLTLNCWY